VAQSSAAAAPAQPAPSALTLRIGRVGVEITRGFDPHLLSDVLSVLEERC
jgi:hypothetical protein